MIMTMMALNILLQLLLLFHPPITKFPLFYIKNFSLGGQPSELAQLLNEAKTKKIVFRLYQNNTGSFSLVAFGGKMGHKFDELREIRLTDTLSVNITPTEFFIGDVELSSKNRGGGTSTDDIEVLRNIRDRTNGSKVEYILFTPTVDSIADGKYKNFKYYLSYQLDTLSTLDNLSERVGSKASLKLLLRNKPNPSPPYDGD